MTGLDTTALGLLAARSMEQLQDRYGEQDVALTMAALVLEVETEDSWDHLVIATDPRPHFQTTLLDQGIRAVEDTMDRENKEED